MVDLLVRLLLLELRLPFGLEAYALGRLVRLAQRAPSLVHLSHLLITHHRRVTTINGDNLIY